mmetsp:Transcript_3524/g.7153  ORF Transcript_3524/g.7153 Transcript_3524/m.7153 type:complete len:363 (-) Transcript_3524:1480-2568(-)
MNSKSMVKCSMMSDTARYGTTCRGVSCKRPFFVSTPRPVLGYHRKHFHAPDTVFERVGESRNTATTPSFSSSVPSSSQGDDRAMVERLLDLVGTEAPDGSADTVADKDAVHDVLNSLEEVGKGTRPLEDERVFGNYNVAYVSMGGTQPGQPAGGRFRTGLGRFLFKTVGLYQSVFKPDIVVNKVDLRIFGCIPCSVGLRGKLLPVVPDGEEDAADTAKVFFDPPVLALPFGIYAKIGPKSAVVLKTTYVDDDVRIGKGSRGSLFVFTRGGSSEEAGMEQFGLQQTSFLGKLLVTLFVGGIASAGAWLLWSYVTAWKSVSTAVPSPILGALGIFLCLIGAVLAFVFVRGGIDSTEEAMPEIVQ